MSAHVICARLCTWVWHKQASAVGSAPIVAMSEKNTGAASASEPEPRVKPGKVVIKLINAGTKYPVVKPKTVQVQVKKPEKPKRTHQDHVNDNRSLLNFSLVELASMPNKNVQSDRWCANLSSRARAHGWWKVR